MKRDIALLILILTGGWNTLTAQNTASSAMTANEPGSYVPYNISEEGVEQPVRWGIDTAWLWDWWPLRATNHMRECVSLGRVTIDPRTSGTYSSLDASQTERLDTQTGWLKKSGITDLYLLCGNASGSSWQTSFRNSYVADIAMGVEYLKSKGYKVIAIAPFNEPDYGANNAPTPEEMAIVSRMLREHNVTKDIDMCGPNTLNPDYAYSWWDIMKNDVQIGNTHQLAGTFDSFAGFYEKVAESGKKSAGDEMHNINDALIGMNYGMSVGIWWSDYGGYTRAELGCASNDGTRIGYKENRSLWTSAAVFKRKSENLVEAFLGTSERQAGESAFTFVSQDRLAYYDGYGPYYDYTKGTPGGTGYQSGQTNAEYVIEVTYGEDVPVGPISGKFKIVNKASGKVLCPTRGSVSGGTGISLNTDGETKNQTWMIEAANPRCGGDFSYVNIYSTGNTTTKYYLDANKYDADNGAKVMLYAGGGNECERWHLRYKGNGYYVITNHDSGLSLEGSTNNSSSTTTGVVQWERTGTDRQLWRFMPADAEVEFVAPAVPSGLQAESLSGSVRLTWNANTEEDLLGYMVYRYNEGAGIWETIGRQVKGTEFIDNICSKGETHKYRLRAVDKAWNVSDASEETSGTTSSEPALVAHWGMRSSLEDMSENKMHAVGHDIEFNTTDSHAGAVLDGTNYISMPYNIGNMQEMTFSAWVKVGTTKIWQRIFDFGRNTENYLFLTNSNGSYVRFEICKDGIKQGLNATKRLSANVWTHIAVTIGSSGTKIYLDGTLNASTTDITFKPSDVTPSLAYIGRSMFDSDPLFQGAIGDVRIYNYPLEAEAIKELYYTDQLNTAEEMTSTPMYASTRIALLQAIEDAEGAIEKGDDTAITSALKSLKTAVSKAQTSIEAYKPLGEALDWSLQKANDYPQQNAEAQSTYAADFATMEADYKNGVFTNTQISSAIIEVKTFTNKYLMADIVDSATEESPREITHLMENPKFEGNSTEGWTITTNETGYSGAANYECFEIWNHTFNLYQILYGMPDGKYRLRVQAFYRNGGKANSGNTDVNAMIYINDNTATIAPISKGANTSTGAGDWYEYTSNKHVPNDMQSASVAFNTHYKYAPISSTNTLIADYDDSKSPKLTIGMKKTDSVYDDWTIINYFKLHYMGKLTSTAIDEMEDNTLTEMSVYDITGRKISTISQTSELQQFAPGIYIVNGKKIIVTVR